MILLVHFIDYSPIPLPVSDSFNMLIFWVYLLYVSDDRWYISALWVVLKEVIGLAVIGFNMEVFNRVASASYSTLMIPSPLRSIYMLAANLLLFIVYFAASKMKKTYSPIYSPSLFFFLASNICIYFTLDILLALQIQQPNEDWHYFVAYAFLLTDSLISVFLYRHITDVVKREHQAQLALNHAQLTSKYQNTIKELYADMIARQHDFKHQLQTIQQLVEQGHSVQAKAYATEYEQRMSYHEAFVTGSIAVDALLTAKQLICKEKNIKFDVVHYPLNDLPIDEMEFCSIVGNLIDNAIEGTCRIVGVQSLRWIRLSFQRVWDTFTILCENNMSPQTLKRYADRFITSKENEPHLHGLGIRNIEQIAQNADGFCDFEAIDDVFIAKVTLPYPIREANDSCGRL